MQVGGGPSTFILSLKSFLPCLILGQVFSLASSSPTKSGGLISKPQGILLSPLLSDGTTGSFLGFWGIELSSCLSTTYRAEPSPQPSPEVLLDGALEIILAPLIFTESSLSTFS